MIFKPIAPRPYGVLLPTVLGYEEIKENEMEDIIEKMTHIATWLKAVSLSPYSRCHEKAELLLEACKRIKKLEAENKAVISRAEAAESDWQLAEERIQELEGDKNHPESYCHLCGGKNITWYVDNELWNKVIDSKVTILCPICFIKIAEQKNIKPTAWRLSMEGDAPEVDILRIKLVGQVERIQELEAALERIDNWAKAYPLKVFPEPDFKKVAEVLKAAGLSLDAVSASNMRHVITGVKDIVEQALKGE